MRTLASLESIGSLLEGDHQNPFELLGPHEVEQDGRKALAVRAFLPQTDQAWLIDSVTLGASQTLGASKSSRRLPSAHDSAPKRWNRRPGGSS